MPAAAFDIEHYDVPERLYAEVVGVATIADRATGSQEKIEAEGLTYVSAFSMEDLGLA